MKERLKLIAEAKKNSNEGSKLESACFKNHRNNIFMPKNVSELISNKVGITSKVEIALLGGAKEK